MYVRIAIIAAAGLLGYFVGSGLTSGEYESKLRAQAESATASINAAVEAANLKSEAQRKQDVAQATARAQRSAAAKGITHEIHAAGPGTDWTPDERLRLERLYGANGFNPDGTPFGVSDRLPMAAEPGDATK